MKKTILKTALICTLVSYGLSTHAVAPPPRHEHKTPPGHHNAPFDGGASLLVATGLVYGIKKAYNSRKTVKQ